VDVIDEINIQKRYNIIDIEIELFKFLFISFKCWRKYNIVSIVDSNNSGSVGNAISIEPNLIPKFDDEMEIGVRKIIR
jgi:hypothetical protein